MRVSRFLGVLGVLLTASQARSAILGKFLGLDRMMECSDVVIVADIVENLEPKKTKLPATAIVGCLPFAKYKIHVLMTLKGEVSSEHTVVSLQTRPAYRPNPPIVVRDGGITVYPGKHIGLPLGARYILFLAERPDKQKETCLQNLNNLGSTMRVSPNSNLDEVMGKSTKEVIRALLQDYVRDQRKGLQLMEASVSNILGESGHRTIALSLCLAVMAGFCLVVVAVVWRRARAAR